MKATEFELAGWTPEEAVAILRTERERADQKRKLPPPFVASIRMSTAELQRCPARREKRIAEIARKVAWKAIRQYDHDVAEAVRKARESREADA